MPLVRYFLFTSAMLLGLLFAANRYFPPPADESDVAALDRSVIRIHTAHRWPAAVRFDTSAPIPQPPPQIAPPIVASSQTPLPARVRETYAYIPPAPPKPAGRHRRRARAVARLQAPEPHRQLAYQTDWASAAR
jgi:hypothetical protein